MQALIETSGARAGQCRLTPGCPTECRAVADSRDRSAPAVFPDFRWRAKSGTKAGCQPGSTTEPWGDAFDCMAEADRDAVTWVMVNVAKAMAAYEFKLVSRDSAFDRYVNGVAAGLPRDYRTFSEAAERGARLFIGKGACNECHSTPLMSDSKFHNVGVAQVGPGVPTEADCPAGGVCDCVTVSADHAGNNCLPWGAADGLYKLKSNRWRKDLRWSDDLSDISRKYWVDLRHGHDPQRNLADAFLAQRRPDRPLHAQRFAPHPGRGAGALQPGRIAERTGQPSRPRSNRSSVTPRKKPT